MQLVMATEIYVNYVLLEHDHASHNNVSGALDS